MAFSCLKMRTLLVVITDASGTKTVYATQTVSLERKPRAALVECPLVAEPGKPFGCGFATIGGTSETFNVEYDEAGVAEPTSLNNIGK